MNKKRMLEIILSIAIVLIILIFALRFLPKEQPKQGITEKTEDKTLEMQKQAEDYMSNFFDKIAEDTNIISCIATISNNISICNEIKESDKCMNNYYLYREVLFNEDSCNNIKDGKKQICEMVKTNKASACSSLEEKELCENVFSIINILKNNKNCTTLNFDNYVFCEAKKANDQNICILARAFAEEQMTDDICKNHLDEISPAAKSYCLKYRMG